MKYMKRAKIYQCSNYNCKFSAEKLEAWSYHWWNFVKVIEGKLVFNNYRYSNSTSKHQSKVRALLNQLGIKIDIELPCPKGLQEYSELKTLIVDAEESLCDAFLEHESNKIRWSERAKQRRIEKRNAEFEKALEFITDHAIKHKLTIVEPGIGEYTIGAPNIKES